MTPPGFDRVAYALSLLAPASMADLAADYARRGWYVFPLRGKVPLPGTAGFRDATCDPEKVVAIWRANPTANIGLAPGPSGFLVIDVDGAAGLESAQRLGLLDATPLKVKTGKGFHLYFQNPGVVREGAGKASPFGAGSGLDVRAAKGYVVAPGSLHPEGSRYAWSDCTANTPAAPVPAALLPALTAPGASQAPAAPAATAALPEGSRNVTLTSLAGTMRRRGFSAAAIEAALLVENASRCVPPLPAGDVHTIAFSIAGHAPAVTDAVEAILTTPAASDASLVRQVAELLGVPFGVAQKIVSAAPQPADEGAEDRLMTLGDLYDDPELLKVPEQVSEWLVRRGEFVLLAGAKKAGKSTLARLDAVSAANRGERVLWIAAEEPRNVFTYWFKKMGAPRTMTILERPKSWAEIAAAIERVQPTVIYVDTFHGLLNSVGEALPEAYETAKWQLLTDRFRVLAQGASVVLLHHMNKSGDATGSEGITSATDTNIYLKLGRDSNVRVLRFESRWGNRELALSYTGDEAPGYAAARAGTESDFRPQSDDKYLDGRTWQSRVFRAVVDAGADGLPEPAWRTAVIGEYSRRSFVRAREDLEDKGWLEARGGVYYATERGLDAVAMIDGKGKGDLSDIAN